MIIRLLFFVALIAAIVFALFWWIGHSFQKKVKSMFSSASKPPEVEKLIQCAVCQTFIPKSKAVKKKDDYYCCEEHANLTK